VIRRWLSVAFLIVFCAAPAPLAASERGQTEAAYQAEKKEWQSRFQEARELITATRSRHQSAEAAYIQMRHRRRERGAEKQAILAELSDSKAALIDAEAALESLFETARRAGVPPGWRRAPRGAQPGPASR
jgi:chromosome segregation ATPase